MSPIPADEAKRRMDKKQNREAVLNAVANGRQRFNEIEADTELSSATVSKYLKQLVESGTLQKTEDGTYQPVSLKDADKQILRLVEVSDGSLEKSRINNEVDADKKEIEQALNRLHEWRYLEVQTERVVPYAKFYEKTGRCPQCNEPAIGQVFVSKQHITAGLEQEVTVRIHAACLPDESFAYYDEYYGTEWNLPLLCDHCALPLDPEELRKLLSDGRENKEAAEEAIKQLMGPVGVLYSQMEEKELDALVSRDNWSNAGNQYGIYSTEDGDYHAHCYREIEGGE